MTVTYDSLRSMLSARQYQPVYILHGEEGYFIDQLVKMFEQIVPDDLKDFNQHVFYGPQVDARTVMGLAGQVPMMGEHMVVIVKEAQAMRADEVNRYHEYVRKPAPDTIFVLCFRGDKMKGKDLSAACKASNAVIFESKKIYPDRIAGEIVKRFGELGLKADPKAVELMAEYIGTDLSRLFNEITKLSKILPPGGKVTAEAVEANVGISKEYNNFELCDALAARDGVKVFRIVDNFTRNPKANPAVLTATAIFGLFSDLLIIYYTPDKSDQSLMKALGLRFGMQLRRYRVAMANYNAFQTIEIIHAIRQFDCQIKGNGSRRDPYALLHELCYHILTARGKLL